MKKSVFPRGGGNCLNSNAALKVCTFLVTLAAACSLALAEIAYPTVINDAAFWLDASDASTITLDENGNVIKDESGNVEITIDYYGNLVTYKQKEFNKLVSEETNKDAHSIEELKVTQDKYDALKEADNEYIDAL